MSSNDALTPAGADAMHRGLAAVMPIGVSEVPIHDDHVDAPNASEMSRRSAMKLLSLTALLGATAGCVRKPERRIISLHDRPEYQQPGKPLYYASTFTEGNYPYGLLVKQIDGRPVKLEGLVGHPLNPNGKSTGAMQASLFGLYDPERLRSPRSGDADVTWAAADKAVVAALKDARRVLVVTRANLGPSERALIARFRKAVPGAVHMAYEPAQDRERRLAWQWIYGAAGEVVPSLERARVILSVDADFLGSDGDTLTATRGFAAAREPGSASFARLYVAESGMTVTGSMADHRVPLRPSHALAFARGLQAAIVGNDTAPLEQAAATHGWDAGVLVALVKDLRANRGTAAVLGGPNLPALAHEAIAEVNAALAAPLTWNAEPATSVAVAPRELLSAVASAPDAVILLGVNPVHDLPGGGFAAALAGVKTVVAHGLTADETLAAAHIALPSAHALESWSDASPAPGVKSVAQPMIAPLFGGRQQADSLLAWTIALSPDDVALKDAKDFHGWMQAQWGLKQAGWEAALRAGFVGTAAFAPLPTPRKVTVRDEPAPPTAGRMDIVLAVHPHTGDGRWQGNAWLLETPEPCNKVVWDNVAAMAPATARALGVEEGDPVEIVVGEARVRLPALPQPGVQADTVVLHVGYGRTQGAGHGNGVGVNVASLGAGVVAGTVAKAGGDRALVAKTQHVFDQNWSNTGTPMERHIAIDGTPKEYAHYQQGEKAAKYSFPDTKKHKIKLTQLDPEVDYSQGAKWGLAIDLNKCTGCNACLLACQVENNIVIVGKEEVAKGRDMSWIRIDRYEAGPEENPGILFQPMLCQHCDNAPCETVCPVNATAHSPEGLNEQVYNRCVGTRYCSNNCPYKVRRFNFFNYTGEQTTDPVQELRANPHVTVRTRGVMEKCTFCIQRINAAKFVASNARTPLKDGAIVTACQQACPADAIVFGDANIKGGQVETARKRDLAYHVLEELNVRPNVTYAARIRNAHPDLDAFVPAAADKGGH
ncbi:MAG: 4Fe-4S dicluster domain-containing protein [Planctomycetota bacterium]|nr:4Fe-4S dicluster domain-containing protein [Planctomycetota bacterium]